ncbi:hypothetical protein HD600_001582 [Microbacterium ginsengiterrae]|uniref:Excreted virulence factor EspC (Type VII ESX diderm) n=1 Tax=Microbacterium ginsengiterrae TaxID=546115 RepID=A0A7W9CCK0_9MICO|nr:MULTISPECIES: hypothetical protein [Microbacterium]MBB5743085.1 hypothetical protein [Microbacterium ginsengiterrae]
MADVVIKYTELDHLIAKLGNMIEELSSGSKGAQLRAAIGEPFGRSELTDAAEDSEDRWDDKRESLVEDLTSIHDLAQSIYDDYQKFEDDAAAQFERGADVPSGSTR